METNNEYGAGRPDLVVKDDERLRALVIEVKYARKEEEIQRKFREARQQFADAKYLEQIPEEYTTRMGYCAVFYRKKCLLEKVS